MIVVRGRPLHVAEAASFLQGGERSNELDFSVRDVLKFRTDVPTFLLARAPKLLDDGVELNEPKMGFADATSKGVPELPDADFARAPKQELEVDDPEMGFVLMQPGDWRFSTVREEVNYHV